MRRKLPRWMLVSLSLVLGVAGIYQIVRGPISSNAAEKPTGPIIPPGGPKPIPISFDDQPSATESVRQKSNVFNSFAKSGAAEPKRLTTKMEEARPISSADENSAFSSSSVSEDGEYAAQGEPFGLRNKTARATPRDDASRYSVRPTANESNEGTIPPRGIPPFPAAQGAYDAAPGAGTAATSGDPPAWPRSPSASKESKDAKEPAPFKNPFAQAGTAEKSAAADSGNPPVGGGPATGLKAVPWSDVPPAKSPPANSLPATTLPSDSQPAFGGNYSPSKPSNPFATGVNPLPTAGSTNSSAAKVNLSEGTYPSAGAAPGTLGAVPATVPVTGSDGTGRPGGKQLEGSQSPQVTLEKIAPREIQVGKPAVFEVKIRNTGGIIAQGVEVYDEVPKGTQLLRTVPSASRGSRNELVWAIGALKPGEESKVQMEVMPTAEGEIGSVATVHFRADASAKTISTKPELTLQVASQRQVLIGEDVTLSIKISNPGSGVASGIVLSERVPTGLQHQAGTELEFDVGNLKPGETKNLELSLKAVTAGTVANLLSARGDANLKATERTEINVVAPALKVGMTGPSKRFLERAANYTFSVHNPGTAPAKEIELTTYLPKGLKFVKANNSGQYDSRRHCVVWSLEELPATETGAVQMTALPIEEGEQKLRIEGKAQQGLTDSREASIVVDGVAAVLFEVADLADPIEVGGETSYEIRVTNQGSKAASNIQITAILPSELKPLSAEGPTRHTIEGTKVVFESLPRLSAKADTTFRIRAQALRAGDARLKVQLVADDLRQPVTKEESTRVYADE